MWPGTHLRFGAYLAEHGADALMNSGPYPTIEPGEPVQAIGEAGSVLLAHYLLTHNIGGHDGPPGADAGQTGYYRLRATGHEKRWRETVTSPLLEFAEVRRPEPGAGGASQIGSGGAARAGRPSACQRPQVPHGDVVLDGAARRARRPCQQPGGPRERGDGEGHRAVPPITALRRR